MNQNRSAQYELSLLRAESLMSRWLQHRAGEEEVQKSYSAEYLAANLIEQIKRIERLNVVDKRIEILFDQSSSVLKRWRNELVLDSLQDTELASLSMLLKSVIRNV